MFQKELVYRKKKEKKKTCSMHNIKTQFVRTFIPGRWTRWTFPYPSAEYK